MSCVLKRQSKACNLGAREEWFADVKQRNKHRFLPYRDRPDAHRSLRADGSLLPFSHQVSSRIANWNVVIADERAVAFSTIAKAA